MGWDLGGHIDEVYGMLCVGGGMGWDLGGQIDEIDRMLCV
jgi:hypothetical protein